MDRTRASGARNRGSSPLKGIMYYLYILRFENGKLYTGVTNNLERRTIEHKRKRSRWTSHQGEFSIIYKEKFYNLADAKKKEWELKCTPWGGKLKKKLANSFDRDGGDKITYPPSGG